MFKHNLVAIDGSRLSDKAVDAKIAFASYGRRGIQCAVPGSETNKALEHSKPRVQVVR